MNYMKDSNNLLLYLAEKGALRDKIELSTTAISKAISTSQQTVSRKLIELEKKCFIERNAGPRGMKIKITEKGNEELKSSYLQLKQLFTKKTNYKTNYITGNVMSGLGEGSYYVSLKPYIEQFKEKLGFVPYSGTLNLKVDYQAFLQFIGIQKKITINGFKTSTRTFGSITAYKIKVHGIDSAIILPERTSHDRDKIEVISEHYLRKKLYLHEDDRVKITADDNSRLK